MAVQDAEFQKTDTSLARDKALKLERAKKGPASFLSLSDPPVPPTSQLNW